MSPLAVGAPELVRSIRVLLLRSGGRVGGVKVWKCGMAAGMQCATCGCCCSRGTVDVYGGNVGVWKGCSALDVGANVARRWMGCAEELHGCTALDAAFGEVACVVAWNGVGRGWRRWGRAGCIGVVVRRSGSGLVWSGLVWSGLVWSGVVWSDLIWSDLVRVGVRRSGLGQGWLRQGWGRAGLGRGWTRAGLGWGRQGWAGQDAQWDEMVRLMHMLRRCMHPACNNNTPFCP
eukprot:366458-Chlamydomonas_euryale.AAC.24